MEKCESFDSVMSTHSMRAKPTLKSRIDLLQQTLHFKTANSLPVKDEKQVAEMPKVSLKDVSLKTGPESLKPCKNVRSSLITTNSSVRKQINEHKFDSIAKLFASKTKMPTKKSTFDDQEDDAAQYSEKQPLLLSKSFQPASCIEERKSKKVSNTVSDISSKLINEWKQENLTQKKISYLLLEYYKNDDSKKKSYLSKILKENAYEIAKANMRLVVSGIKKKAIEEEIKRIQLEKDTLQVDKPGSKIGLGRVVLRQITLPLRIHSPSVYVFCVVRQDDKVFASSMLNTSSFSRGKTESEFHFDIDKVFDNLDHNFKVIVQFYFWDLSAPKLENKFSKSSVNKIFEKFKKSVKIAKFITNSMFNKKKRSSNNKNQILNDKLNFLDGENFDQVAIVGSSFKQFGSFTINRDNFTTLQHSIEKFDYFMSPSEDQVYLQMEPSVDFGSKMIYSLGVHTEHHFPLSSDDKAVKFDKFKFVKRSVELDGKYLKVNYKGLDFVKDTFNLGHCLNSGNIEAATVKDLENTICLLFDEPKENSEDPDTSPYLLLFITSPSDELLKRFFNKVMAHVMAVRQWKETVLDSSTFFALAPIEVANESDEIDIESSFISKIVIN